MENQTQGGFHKIKASIQILAPAELCYREWTKLSRLSKYLSRIIEVHTVSHPSVQASDSTALPEETDSKNSTLDSSVHYWTLHGPNGRLYHVQNKTILDIPNRFYCKSSTDDEDICSQLSVLFSSDALNQTTYMEMEASSWLTEKMPLGKSSRLLADIIKTDDNFLKECLEDFKHHVESIRSQSI